MIHLSEKQRSKLHVIYLRVTYAYFTCSDMDKSPESDDVIVTFHTNQTATRTRTRTRLKSKPL